MNAPSPSSPSSRRWIELALIVLVAVVAVGLRARSLDVGLTSDDYAQHGMLAGLYPGQPYAPFDLYAFFRNDPATLAAHVEFGTVPWWTTPDLHGTVMRPLASALLSLDRVLWPAGTEAAIRMWHWHSLAWLAAMLISAGLALRRLVPAPIAALALIFMACEACYATPLAWIANRCALVSATFVFASLWAHLGWREARAAGDRRAAAIYLGVELVGIAAALAAGEYGLAAPAYLAAFELLAGTSKGQDQSARARARTLARNLGPALVLTLVWLLLHRVLGYGTLGSTVYVDPLTAPGAWLEVASERLPKLLAGAFASIPVDTGDMVRRFARSWAPWLDGPADHLRYLAAHRLVAGAVLVGAGALAWCVRPWLEADERRRLTQLGLGAALALVPLTVAPEHSRLLVCAQLGVSVVVAGIVVASMRAARGLVAKISDKPSWGRRARAAVVLPWALVLVYAHTVADLRWGRGYLDVLASLNASVDAAFTHGDLLGTGAHPTGADLGGREVVVLNAISQTAGLHGHYWLDAHGYPAPHSWRSLAMGEYAMVARRVDPHTLELSAIQGAWLLTGAELFFRRRGQGLAAGIAFELPGLRVQIEDDDGAGHPTRVRFRFPHGLDDPRYLFLVSTKTGLRRFAMPAVGQRAAVPRPQLPLVAAFE